MLRETRRRILSKRETRRRKIIKRVENAYLPRNVVSFKYQNPQFFLMSEKKEKWKLNSMFSLAAKIYLSQISNLPFSKSLIFGFLPNLCFQFFCFFSNLFKGFNLRLFKMLQFWRLNFSFLYFNSIEFIDKQQWTISSHNENTSYYKLI